MRLPEFPLTGFSVLRDFSAHAQTAGGRVKRNSYKTTAVTALKAAVSKSRTAQTKTSKKDVRYSRMAKEDRSESLRDEVQELKEEAAALAGRAKKTARPADALSERIKHLETQIAKTP
jgi:septal ring factor EnvC (AmiA/AmiB activator)